MTDYYENVTLQWLVRMVENTLHFPMSMQEYIDVARAGLVSVAPALKIGKIYVKVEIPGTKQFPNGETGERIFYAGESFCEENMREVIYPTSDQGKVTFRIYPETGAKFSEEQMCILKTICNTLFITAGRVRVGYLYHIAMNYDMMTSAPNLALYMKHINELIHKGQISAYNACFLNCKNFKYINDRFSYNDGDGVMRQYAKKLMDFCDGEEMMARLGGDNYVVLYRREKNDEFVKLVHGVEIMAGQGPKAKPVILSAHAGIWEIDHVEQASDVMMRTAMALQVARESRTQDIIYFSQEIASRVLESQRVLMEFDECLKQGELVAYLQPKNDLQTGEICGAEALARWVHDGKLIPPMSFIPALERSGKICELDFVILHQVCRRIAEWTKQGRKVPRISVNLSRWHLKNPNLVSDVAAILKNYGVEPEQIEVELTETVDYEEYNNMIKVFRAFREVGIATSIDDFGTGYSSLNLIMNLDVDVLKIDRAFIKAIDEESSGHKEKILLENIVRMAGELHTEVVAEGVETERQCDFLRKIDCHIAQGFYYHKPMPMEEFDKLI